MNEWEVRRETNNYAQNAILQAGNISDSKIEVRINEDASPQDKFASGRRFLEQGNPRLARKLMFEAFDSPVDGSELRFHWVLALLSKRSYKDLTVDDRVQLDKCWKDLSQYADDAWKRALRAVREIVSCQHDPKGDDAWALEQLMALPSMQRDMVVEHLNLVLTASMKERTWVERRTTAAQARKSNNRRNSVWAYFEPEPTAPFKREIADRFPREDDFMEVIGSVALVTAVGCLGFLALLNADLLSVLAVLVAVISGHVVSHHGLEWRFRMQRLRIKDEEYYGPTPGRVEGTGFTAGVHAKFAYYFNRYPPQGIDGKDWAEESEGIRDTLAHEIARTYRPSRISVGCVTWLIRYLARDTARRWDEGTLWEYQQRYRVRWSTRVWCLFGLVAAIPAMGVIVVYAVGVASVPAIIATVTVVVCGPSAARQMSARACNQRHLIHDTEERDQQHVDRTVEHERWEAKLDSLRPSETQMETWLNSDKVIMLDEMLKHYRLLWRDVVAHAFLQVPGRSCKSQRGDGGQWRYTRYVLRLFIITADGVREIKGKLDFERATLSGLERLNFRFDAVSSVEVYETGRHSGTLELTLMNGTSRQIRVSASDGARPGVVGDSSTIDGQSGHVRESSEADADSDVLDGDEVTGVGDDVPGAEHDATGVDDDAPGIDDDAQVLAVDLDASGFLPTLRILEGIAAEGKNWVNLSNPPESVSLQ